MGTEDNTIDVEESTEPPLGGVVEESTSQSDTARNPARCKTANIVGESSEYESKGYKDAHTVTAAELTRILGVDPQHGLSRTEAASRLERDGLNKVEASNGLSVWKILLRQVSNSLTLVLVITMALSFGINDFIEGGVITAVILLNIVVGFVQDYHAEKTIMSLYALSAPVSKVMRDGALEHVKAETLVLGDIVCLNVGDIVPADLRLIEGMNISTDEALLTGESLPVVKNPHRTFPSPDIPLGDRINMAYSATTMTQGRATGIVVSIGAKTEVGQIAELLHSRAPITEGNIIIRSWVRFRDAVKAVLGLEGTPLQVKLSKFALLLFALAITLAIIVFSTAKWDVNDEVLIYGICVAVAVIPESLIAVLTITVAVGTKAMARGNVIVRKLSALEAVGGVTNICSDKTGTLTQGKMIARKAWIPGAGILTVHDTTNPFDPTSGFVRMDNCEIDPESDEKTSPTEIFLKAIALCNLSSVYKSAADDASISTISESGWIAVGEPTEIALQVLAMRFSYGKPFLIENENLKLLAEFPFDPSLKRMSVIYKNQLNNTIHALMKGAVEVMLPVILSSESERQRISATAEEMASNGLRVLCIAQRPIHENEEDHISDRNLVETNLHFVGLVGLYDPPRLETADAVRRCQMAGITIHMLTGDHIKTATAIAHEVGILRGIAPNASAGSAIMPAADFDKLSDAEIDTIETLPLVLARCSPSTKVRMVEAMHRRKAFCVMTGDGVNDSPALKRSSVGVAMGLNGSDVAKEAADMVLTDDNFASIVKAVEEGRRLFDNIQKFLLHLLISNISQVLLLLIGLAFKDSDGHSVFPLSPLEILWVNLITSSFLALGLGVEEAQSDIMFRPPHDLSVGVFTPELIIDKFVYGTCMGALCIASFASVSFGAGNGQLGLDCNAGWNESCGTVFRARATTYATLSFLLLVTAWEVKHFSRSLFNLYPDLRVSQASGARYFSVFTAVYRNRFLFWAVVAGFVITFPVVYIPVINHEVFKHQGITWEWGIVLACLVVYVACIETWKAVKRKARWGSGKFGILTREDAEARAGLVLTASSTLTGEK